MEGAPPLPSLKSSSDVQRHHSLAPNLCIGLSPRKSQHHTRPGSGRHFHGFLRDGVGFQMAFFNRAKKSLESLCRPCLKKAWLQQSCMGGGSWQPNLTCCMLRSLALSHRAVPTVISMSHIKSLASSNRVIVYNSHGSSCIKTMMLPRANPARRGGCGPQLTAADRRLSSRPAGCLGGGPGPAIRIQYLHGGCGLRGLRRTSRA